MPPDLGSGTKPPDLPDADDGGGECGEGEVNVGAALMSNGETAELGEPRQRPLHLPAMAPEPFAAVDAAPCDTRGDPTGAAFTAASAVVIAFVGVELVRPTARSSARPANRRHGVEGGGQHPAVVPVGPAERQAERRALAIDDQVPLRARLAAVRRIGPGLRAPLLARTDALSSDARLQSRRSAPRSRSSSARCSAAQTPAVCHSTSRRQQVLPLQPICMGTSRHWIPVRNTNKMPASATRSGTLGLPPFGFGGSSGNSGEIAAQRSSGTRGTAINP